MFHFLTLNVFGCSQIQPVNKDFPKVLPSKETNTQKDGNMTHGNTLTGIKKPNQPESKEPQSSAETETEKGLEHYRKESSNINYLSIGNYRVFCHFIVRLSFCLSSRTNQTWHIASLDEKIHVNSNEGTLFVKEGIIAK